MATRRKFVQTSAGMILVSASAAELMLAAGCGGGGSGTPDGQPQVSGGIMTLPLSDWPALASSDGSQAFDVQPAGHVIVAQLDNSGTYVCVSQICTHAACSVSYAGGINGFACPCHGSTYSSTGAVTGGPAPAPLHSYTTTFDGSKVVVDLNS